MTMFATAALARKYELAAARGLAYEAQDLQRALQKAVNDSVRAFRDLHECGIDVAEYVAGLHDAVSNADHALRTTIDEASLHAEHIDLSEVRELLEQVRK